MKVSKITHKLAAAVTAGVLTTQATQGFAVNFSNVTTNIQAGTSNFPNLISSVAYIGGIGLGVAGIFKLKQHVDNPGQHAMKDGLVRLGAGGGLLSLPYITSAMVGTVGTGGQAAMPTFSAATGG